MATTATECAEFPFLITANWLKSLKYCTLIGLNQFLPEIDTNCADYSPESPNLQTDCSKYIIVYIITQIILAFSLVLAYDLLEDRRTIDVIVTKFFPPCFKMAERFENLDNILLLWAKDKVQKGLAAALNRFEKPENEI